MYLLDIIMIVWVAIYFYLLFRTRKIADFRIGILDAELDMLMTDDSLLAARGPNFIIWDNIPSFGTMLFSFWKPLRYSYWLSKEDLELLKPYLIENI